MMFQRVSLKKNPKAVREHASEDVTEDVPLVSLTVSEAASKTMPIVC